MLNGCPQEQEENQKNSGTPSGVPLKITSDLNHLRCYRLTQEVVFRINCSNHEIQMIF